MIEKRFYTLPMQMSTRSFSFILVGALISISLLLIPLFHTSMGIDTNGLIRNFLLSDAYARDLSIKAPHDDIRWPHEKSDLKPDPDLVFGKLPNGFRYVLRVNHKPKNRVSMHLNIQAGSLHESSDQQGLAHFLEHMSFDGSTHFKPGELVKYFQDIGMEFGPDANAHTGFNETVYDILLPTGDRENLVNGLLVIKDYAEGVLLSEEEIEKERNVILAEKRSRDSAAYRTFIATMAFEFPDSLVSQRFPIGDEHVIKTADRNQIKDFYDTWYRPETMILVMVGDFDVDLATRLIQEKFASLAPRAPPRQEPVINGIEHKGINAFYHFEKESGNTDVAIEVIQRINKESDSIRFQKRWLIKHIADQIVNNRLNALVGRPDTPFTKASIGTGLFLNQIEFAQVNAECPPENWKKSLTLIEQSLRQALLYGFTHSEMDRVKKDYSAELDDAVAKASTRESGDLARNIISHINRDRVFMSPIQERELFYPLIQKLTLSELHDEFKHTWSPAHRLVLVTGNAELSGDMSAPEQKIIQVFQASSQQAVAQPTEKKTVVFPYLPIPKEKGKVIRQNQIADLGIIQIEFQNHVLLNVKQTNFKADEILVNMSFGKGNSVEPADLPGLSDLSDQVINESGLGSLEKDDLDRAFAGKQTQLRFQVEEDRFVFKGRTISKETELMFQLLYAHVMDPGRRKDAHALVMERFKQRHQELSKSVDGAFILFGKRFFAGGDSRFGLPVYSNFQKISLKHIKTWVDESLSQDQLEVTIVGDIDPDLIIEQAARYLGTLPMRTGFQTKTDARQPLFPESQRLEIQVETEIPKALLVVAYPTDDFWDIHQTRRLMVLSSIFSDRLRVKIREKIGASYSPFAYNQSFRAYPGYGVFQAHISIEPTQSEIVINEVKKISADLVSNGITSEELSRAIKPMLTGIKDMRQTNGYWLNSVMTGSTDHPEQIDWSRTILTDYASITSQEISELAKTYLNNRRSAVFIVKPIG